MGKKKMTKFFIQFLIVLLLLEIFLRLLFYQRIGRDYLAIAEVARNIKRKLVTQRQEEQTYANFLLVRPDSGNVINKAIAREAEASNRYEYFPWTEYKNIDFSGRYINIKGLARTTTPDEFISADTVPKQTIYFFGGSTMFGVNTTDKETIAAAFVNLYKKQYPRGVSVKVINYGIPAHYSYNELILLSHLVYSNQKPSIAVFLDGLNDFLITGAAQKRLPYYYYRLKMAAKDNINFKELESINDSTATLFNWPGGYTREALVDSLVKNYLSNIENVKKIAASNQFHTFFFIQPNPFYHYPNRTHDPICSKEAAPLVEMAYRVLENKADSIKDCHFLGNMLLKETGYPFIDRFHYSPVMCRRIAEEIVNVVGKQINQH
jgi:lysophospholipase L1-like esterase